MRYPNIPSDVMNINTNMLIVRYSFRKVLVEDQYLNRKLVDTNLPNSKEMAITIAAIAEPENNIDIPSTEKYAAHEAIKSAVNATKRLNVNVCICNLIHRCKMGIMTDFLTNYTSLEFSLFHISYSDLQAR